VPSEIPFLDLAREGRALRAELLEAVAEVVDSGIYLLGPQTERLERELAATLGVEHAVAVGSGTHALQLLLLACGIGPGDEVVTTPASFYATAKSVELAGAVPVFADVDPQTYNLDPARVEAALTPRTKAILAVDLYGHPAPLRELRAIADAAGLLLLQDAAQSFGSSLEGLPPGRLGHGAVLSFYPTKNVGALGDAGAVLTSDEAIAARVRSMRMLGTTEERDRFEPVGISARIDELQAALLLVKLRHADEQLAVRRRLARRYDDELPDELVRRVDTDGAVSAHHLYVVRSGARDALRAHLAEHGIATQVHYAHPLHLQSAFRDQAPPLPVAERWAREVLSLPLNPYVADDEQTRIVEAARAFRPPR